MIIAGGIGGSTHSLLRSNIELGSTSTFPNQPQGQFPGQFQNQNQFNQIGGQLNPFSSSMSASSSSSSSSSSSPSSSSSSYIPSTTASSWFSRLFSSLISVDETTESASSSSSSLLSQSSSTSTASSRIGDTSADSPTQIGANQSIQPFGQVDPNNPIMDPNANADPNGGSNSDPNGNSNDPKWYHLNHHLIHQSLTLPALLFKLSMMFLCGLANWCVVCALCHVNLQLVQHSNKPIANFPLHSSSASVSHNSSSGSGSGKAESIKFPSSFISVFTHSISTIWYSCCKTYVILFFLNSIIKLMYLALALALHDKAIVLYYTFVTVLMSVYVYIQIGLLFLIPLSVDRLDVPAVVHFSTSIALVHRNLLGCIGFFIIMSIIQVLGLLLCVCGFFPALAICYLMTAVAYSDIIGVHTVVFYPANAPGLVADAVTAIVEEEDKKNNNSKIINSSSGQVHRKRVDANDDIENGDGSEYNSTRSGRNDGNSNYGNTVSKVDADMANAIKKAMQG
jgi:hypothetical protein